MTPFLSDSQKKTISTQITVQERYLQSELTGIRPQVQQAIGAYIRRVATEHADEVLSITLYGSQARGEADEESDIDLLVVVRHATPTLRQALVDLAWEVQFEHNVVISDIIYDIGQWRRLQDRQFPYYQSIRSEGILLWTNTSEPMPGYD